MKILLDARTVGKEFSGVGNYVLELVRAFAALDEDVQFHLCIHGDSRLRDLALDDRFRFLETTVSHESHPRGDLWEQFVLPRQARALGADVLHGPAFLIPTRPGPVRKVVTVHDLVAFTHPETIPRKYALYMRWLIRRVVKGADRVITDSESVCADLVRLLSADQARVECIPLGVSSRFRPPPDAEVARVRERLQLPNPYLLFVGNLEPRKNLTGLLRTFRSVQERVEGPLDLVIAGKVGWLSRLLPEDLRLGDGGGCVRMPGYVEPEDLPALYGGAEVFVFPTFWEGFGLPVLEAMACETPVVASGNSSIPEVAGDAAVLVDPHSCDSIASGILEILLSPRRRQDLRRRGRERARAFPWDRTARETLAVYRAACGDAAP